MLHLDRRLTPAALLFLLGLPLAPVVAGQQRRAEPALKVFRVRGTVTTSPAARVVVPGQPAEEPGVRPPRRVASNEAARTAAIQVLKAPGGGGPGGPGTLAAPRPGELQDVTLTSQRPWINEQAYVTYNLPYGVVTSTGSVMFAKGYPGATGVYFKAVAGHSYLVDFAVDSWGPGTYRIKSGDVEQTFENAEGAQHLMAGVQATESGWIHLFLTRFEGTGYYVQEVRVTRVN